MDEIEEWKVSKSSGEQHRLNKKKGKTSKWSRSKGKRVVRHSHHRRRNHIRNQVARGTLDAETIPPPSSTKAYTFGRFWSSHSYPISNRKTM